MYGIFHGNLQFSSIPEDQYPVLLDKCYWPLLDLAREFGWPLGFEFPAWSLEVLNKIDASFVKELSQGWKDGLWEIIGSGYSQVIMPLTPARLNLENLEWGQRIYESLLGKHPKVAYVNEQVISRGLTELYGQAGYRYLFLDWDNTVAAAQLSNDLRYKPQWLKGAKIKRVGIIWNSFISFQRFQRYIHGEINLKGYIDFLLSHYHPANDRAISFYGSDWEIFDYRPGSIDAYLPVTSNQKEVSRLKELLHVLNDDHRFALISPSNVAEVLTPEGEVDVCSSSYPIPCKKQAKYNVVRWAVCGRENSKKNTLMYRTFKLLQDVESMQKAILPSTDKAVYDVSSGWKELSYFWGSDFRTFTTEEKNNIFNLGLGHLYGELTEARSKLISSLNINKEILNNEEDGFKKSVINSNNRQADKYTVMIYNPHSFEWAGYPFEFDVSFAPGQFWGPLTLETGEGCINTQNEALAFYRDGSLRKVRLVITPYLHPGQLIRPQIVPKQNNSDKIRPSNWLPCYKLKTSEVDISFLPRRGGAIGSLYFPGIAQNRLAGTISHDFYNHMELSTDQYTGHCIIFDKKYGKITDLGLVEPVMPDNPEDYPIRVPVMIRLSMPLGELWKQYFVYRNIPRVDLRYHFRFNNINPELIRLGIITFDPCSYNRRKLYLASVNGGQEIEVFPLSGANLSQSNSVDPRVSAGHCLGATEGWLAVGDDEKGVAVITNKSVLYSVPLVDYREINDLFYLRVYNSICETDETSGHFWRGHNIYDISYIGYENDLEQIRRFSNAINNGLICCQQEEV
ncbi:hypothetical protein L7E55_12415 [Pelotomaculum isophthalicicum JI]|uniref:Glycoside hydrolase family 57 N-terminal domain-containing protein n=1 Tax=Pelotomaculum isophthalicicum JI TaxID=947010 RepID=A0A9X4H760_9FIRM|nr:hypothetical protein [Pelotomaculum isophthalicicum]MDF9409149.1 hypothetical protein [Pelotomaculum isophthalicicum JI]